jgi:hypothetical protein
LVAGGAATQLRDVPGWMAGEVGALARWLAQGVVQHIESEADCRRCSNTRQPGYKDLEMGQMEQKVADVAEMEAGQARIEFRSSERF